MHGWQHGCRACILSQWDSCVLMWRHGSFEVKGEGRCVMSQWVNGDEQSKPRQARISIKWIFPSIPEANKGMSNLSTLQLLPHILFVLEVLTTKDIHLNLSECISKVTPWSNEKLCLEMTSTPDAGFLTAPLWLMRCAHRVTDLSKRLIILT